jgi:hypothetical protein
MIVTLPWVLVRNSDDDLLDEQGVIYCLSDAALDDEPLYIGKADYGTTRVRWCCHKNEVRSFIREELGIRKIRRRIAIPKTQMRLTSALLADVESLLICQLNPRGNIQCQTTRIARPGLKVRCKGNWPWTTVFADA